MKKYGITQRWLVNCLGVITIILVAVLLACSFFTKQFYYDSAKQTISSNIQMVSHQLRKSFEDSPSTFSSEVRGVIEGWAYKDTMELMAINKKGNIVLTSSGFAPSYSQDMKDYYEALETGSDGFYIGPLSSGEMCMSATVLIPESTSEYTAIRIITSLEGVNAHIHTVIFALAATCASVVFLISISGLFFVKSIILPIRELEITAKKLSEGDFSARLAKKNDDEIGELCDIFNKMAEELSQSENMKNEFISSVSHELRTPLTAIKGWSETISSMPEDSAAITKGMRVIGSETDRLSQMVEELLDFSRIQSGRFTLHKGTIDILAELGDAVLIYTEKAKGDNIKVVYDEPDMLPFVYGDKNRLRQVFINVIDNAIKYSDKGGLISIQASMRDDTHIQIDISDKGCGISPEDLPKIKTKFYKANHTRRGSGIGLAVADEIITMHDGMLNVFSEQGVGTTVTIILPVQQKK